MSPNGTITTVAGTGHPLLAGPGSSSGEGGPATKAALFGPWGLAVDAAGNVYIADGGRILEIVQTPLPAAGPRLALASRSPQRLLANNGITVSAGCDRPSTLTATGSVTIGGTKTSFPLTPATVTLKAPGSTNLTLGLSDTQRKRLDPLLKPGARAQATITVRAIDRLGHVCTSQRTVAVKR